MHRETLIAAVNAGAHQLKSFFNQKFTISHKEGVNNLVTEADFASDKAIRSIIKMPFLMMALSVKKAAKKKQIPNING